ncbi:hypothetical protein ZIOFF_045015 [Zingiber officinale]|uniref:Uncharacterized protein n=1 Tax=Zingiber officinale TaxID=94328 RepID=A0A8J5KXV0_ZINOF|nr:hypothetical protein ZIOFF_045015 [Zingiber officinale]
MGRRPSMRIKILEHIQLVLETAAIEILSLPASASQVAASLVQIIVHIKPTVIQSGSGIPHGQTSGLPTSPSAGIILFNDPSMWAFACSATVRISSTTVF